MNVIKIDKVAAMREREREIGSLVENANVQSISEGLLLLPSLLPFS